jgi:hypothetical protein
LILGGGGNVLFLTARWERKPRFQGRPSLEDVVCYGMEQNITPYPDDITLFGAKGILLTSYSLTNPIEKFLGVLFHDFSRAILISLARLSLLVLHLK